MACYIHQRLLKLTTSNWQINHLQAAGSYAPLTSTSAAFQRDLTRLRPVPFAPFCDAVDAAAAAQRRILAVSVVPFCSIRCAPNGVAMQ